MTPKTPQISRIPSRDVLAGLARIHPFLLLTDSRGRIAWVSEQLGKRLCQLRAGQGERAIEGPELLREIRERLPKPEQLETLSRELREHPYVAHAHLDLRTRGGKPLRLSVSACRVETPEPGGPHYVVIARLPEEQDRLERKLHGKVELLSRIADSSPNGVITTDRSGFVTYTNPAGAALLGDEQRNLIGKPVAMLLPYTAASDDLLGKISRPTDWSGEEIERVDARGRSFWMSVSTRPLRTDDGRIAGSVAYLNDITRRREIEAELSLKNTELESCIDAMAHDLRSPLVSLLGFARLLRQDYEAVLDQTGHHFVDRIEQAGRTMETLIHDLLELSRIGSVGVPCPVADPRTVLSQLAAELKLRLEEESVELALPSDAPMLQIDSTRLYQLFSNLLGNALNHMGPGGQRRVSVEISEHDRQHEIVVSDNGRGIAREDHERIFKVFQTCGPSRSAGQHSSGIGLAIVKKIAESCGGRAWVESAPGEGARFHVALPAH